MSAGIDSKDIPARAQARQAVPATTIRRCAACRPFLSQFQNAYPHHCDCGSLCRHSLLIGHAARYCARWLRGSRNTDQHEQHQSGLAVNCVGIQPQFSKEHEG